MRRAVAGIAYGLVVLLRKSLDEYVRQGVGLHFAQTAIELAVQLPFPHGLAARTAIETLVKIGRIESSDEINERGAHGFDHRAVVLARTGE